MRATAMICDRLTAVRVIVIRTDGPEGCWTAEFNEMEDACSAVVEAGLVESERLARMISVGAARGIYFAKSEGIEAKQLLAVGFAVHTLQKLQ